MFNELRHTWLDMLTHSRHFPVNSRSAPFAVFKVYNPRPTKIVHKTEFFFKKNKNLGFLSFCSFVACLLSYELFYV